jgi:alpha-tubulin suppressor-like RCC1 family protein
LGYGVKQDSATPVKAQIAGSATMLTSGSRHACVILNNASRSLQCWGYNYFGEIGDGSTVERDAPVDVKNLSQVSSVSGGAYDTCAIVNGAVYCWGRNGIGQLGNGTTAYNTLPGLVTGF